MKKRGQSFFALEGLESRVLLSSTLTPACESAEATVLPELLAERASAESEFSIPTTRPDDLTYDPAAAVDDIFGSGKPLERQGAPRFSALGHGGPHKTFSPANAPGPLPGPHNVAVAETFAADDDYVWEINDVDAGAGASPGWDKIDFADTLTIAATPSDKFILRITSLTAGNAPGQVADFNGAQSYSWVIARAVNGVLNFNREAFDVVTTGFTNPFAGSFVVELINGDRDLIVRYLPNLPAVIGNNPAWVEQGPDIITGGHVNGIPNQPAVGAVHALAPHPANPDILYAGTVSGGVWRTLNATAANPAWTPLTDALPSLFVSALAISPFTNAGGAVVAATPFSDLVLYMGTGSFSNSYFRGEGTGAKGIYKSTDGGATWSITGTAADSANLNPYRITSIVPSSSTNNLVYVGTADAGAGGGGAYKSSNGGTKWELLSGANGLPQGSVSDLARDPGNAARYYISLAGLYDANGDGNYYNDGAHANNGIYRTNNNGTLWTPINTGLLTRDDFNNDDDDGDGNDDQADGTEGLKLASRIRLAVSPAGTNPVYAAISDWSGKLAAVYRSADQGNTWRTMGIPRPESLLSQGATNLSLLADSADANVVYLGGNSPPNLFRGDAAAAGWVALSAASTDASYAGALLPVVNVLLGSRSPGIAITESGGNTAVTEGAGGPDTYQVVLKSQPSQDVRIMLSASQVTARDNANPANTFLTFTNANWNVAQTVRVTAIDDSTGEARLHTGTIAHLAYSNDRAYDGVTTPSVSVRVTDNEALPGITITEPDNITLVNEGAGSDTYTIVLDRQPNFDVLINLVADADIVAEDNANPGVSALLFTPANWNVAQTVRVTGVDDLTPEPSPHRVRIRHTVTPSDPAETRYLATLNLPALTVHVVDDSAGGVSIVETNGTTQMQEGAQDTFWVVLNHLPTDTVTINLNALVPNNQVTAVDSANPANAFLTFTTANWFTPQQVLVTGVADADVQDTWSNLALNGANGTQPHADSRAMVYDANGNILEADDGGIYRLQNPTNLAIRAWSAVNGDLRITEIHRSVAYDSFTNTIFAGTQDNAVIYQTAGDPMTWTNETGGDGNYVAAVDLGGSSIRYEMGNNFRSFVRRVFGPPGVTEQDRVYHPITNVTRQVGGAHDGEIVIESLAHGLATGDYVAIDDVDGVAAANSTTLRQITKVDNDHFILDDVDFFGGYLAGGTWVQYHPITGSTFTATDIRITSAGHGLTDGDRVRIINMRGNTAANNMEFRVRWVSASQFELMNITGNGAYTGGGFWRRSHEVLLKAADNQARLSGLDNVRSLVIDGVTHVPDRQFTAFTGLPYTANAVDSKRLLLGRVMLYESTATWGDLITPLPYADNGRLISALAYGGKLAGVNHNDVIYVAREGQVAVRPHGGALTARPLFGASKIFKIVLDPENYQQALAVDASHVWVTADAGVTWVDVGPDLVNKTNTFRALEIRIEDGKLAILVGTANGVWRALAQDAADFFAKAAAGVAPAVSWTRYGTGFPNALVTDIKSNTTDDVIVASTLGRGVWMIPNAESSLFAEPRLFIETGAGDDEVELRINSSSPTVAQMLEVLIGGVTQASVPYNSIARIDVHTNGGTDKLIIDHANGEIKLAEKIHFDAGGGGLDELWFEGPQASAIAGRLLALRDSAPAGDPIVLTLNAESLQNLGVLQNIILRLRDAWSRAGDWFGQWGRDQQLAQNSPLFMPDIAQALVTPALSPNGSVTDEEDLFPTDIVVRGDERDGRVPSNLFLRLVESGTGAFRWEDLGRTITTASQLATALDGLDSIPGNVTVSTVGSTTRYVAEIQKTLNGQASFDLVALEGMLELHGNLDISALVKLKIAFGADDDGFFLETNASVDPELIISQITIDGSVSGSGRFGFLEVTLTDGTVTMAPNVKIEVDLVEAAPDPVSGVLDGKLRLYELTAEAGEYFTVDIEDDPAADDLELAGKFTVSALNFDGEPLFDIGTAEVSIIWPTIDEITRIRVEATGGPAATLLQFLNFSPEEMLEKVQEFLNWLRQFRESEFFDVEIPFTSGTTVGEVFDFSDAFIQKLYGYFVDTEVAASTGGSSPSATLSLGRLTANSEFILEIDDEEVEVSLPLSATSGNASLADLAADINEAFAEAGLSAKVQALLREQKIVFQLIRGVAGPIRVRSEDSGDPIITEVGFTNNQTGFEIPRFKSAQELLRQLMEAMDPDGDGPLSFNILPSYDSATKSVKFAAELILEKTHTVSFAYDPEISLGDVVDVEASGDITLSASVKLGVIFGIDLTPAEVPSLTTSAFIPPPSNGQLTESATFSLNINDGDLVIVTVPVTANSSLDDLVADFRTAMLAATYGGQPLWKKVYVRKSESGTGLVMEAVHEPDLNGNGLLEPSEDLNGSGARELMLGVINSLKIEAEVDDPIATEVGFNNQSVSRTTVKGVFIESPSLQASLSVEASNLAASARLGIFEISTSGGSASGTVAVAAGLKNPASSSARIYISELFDGLGSIGDVLSPETELSGNLEFELNSITIAPNLFGLPSGAQVAVLIPDIHDLEYNPDPYDGTNTGVFVTYPELGPLFHFKCLAFTDVLIALDGVVDQLEEMKGFSFLANDLPLVNMSVSEILDYAADFAEMIQGLAEGDAETIATLETDIEAFFGIDPSLITLSVEHTADPTTSGGSSTLPATATFNPFGSNNALKFQSATPGTAHNDIVIDFVDDGTLTAGADVAAVSWDSVERVLTIKYNASYTRASTVIAAVNASNTAGASPVTVSRDTVAESGDSSGVITQTALKASFNYTLAYANTFPLAFDLESLVGLLDPSSTAAQLLSEITNLIQLEGSASLEVTASASLTIDFGVDVSNPCHWMPFLYDTTGLTLKAKVLGTDLEFTAGIGPVGIHVQNGTVTLDADGDPATTGAGSEASFTVGLEDNNGDGRHYFRSGETFFDDDNLSITLTAGASAILPLYFPTPSVALGGTGDANGDGYPDNQLVVLIPDLKRVFKTESTAFDGTANRATVTFPGANNDLVFTSPSAGVPIKFIEATGTPSASVSGGALEVRIDSAITTASQVVALTYPAGYSAALSASTETSTTNNGTGAVYTPVTIITPDLNALFDGINLCDIVTHAGVLLDGLDALLGSIQDGLSSEFAARNLPLVGDKLGNAADFIGDFRSGLLANIRAKLAEAGDPIALVKQAIFDLLGPPGLDILVKTDGTELTSFDDIEIECNADQIDFRLRLHKEKALVDTSDNPINLDIGVDGFGLSVEGNVRVEIGFDLKLYFGISASDGFFFDTSDSQELSVELEVTIPGLTATGELFFLQLQVSDESDGKDAKGNDRDPSSFTGSFTVDLLDPAGSGDKLTFADMTNSAFDFEDFVDAELSATAEVNLDLEVSFDGDAQFPRLLAEFDLDWTWTAGGDDNGDLELGLNNIQLDVGTFLGNFIQPILTEIRKVTEPLDPIIDILTFRLPVISDLAGEDVTLLDLAEAFGYLSPSTRDFIDSVIGIIDLINDSTLTSGGSVLVPIGSFDLNVDSAGNVERDTSAGEGDAVDLEESTTDSEAKGFLGKLKDLGFTFPFLQPSELFKLFRGEAVSLVEYQMPVLEFDFSYTQSFPIYPPLYARFTGSMGARVELTFGYDTLGLQEFFSSADKDVADLFNGFYVKDVDDDGNEVVELTLTGGLTAGASLSLLIAEAGVQGGIFATVEFDLNDPNDDGKVRLNEIIANAREDIRCIFDIHGEIVAALEAFLKIDLLFFEIDKTWRFAEITLIEFDLTCPQPVLASVDGSGNLTLHMGTNAGLRVYPDTTDNAETFVVSHVSGSPTSTDGETVNVSWGGYVQSFSGVKKVIVDAGQGNDVVDLRGVLSPAEVDGGDGQDTIYASEGGGTIHGDGGADVIAGDIADDIIYGDDGADTISGNDGNDTIEGGAGNDKLYGNAGTDTITGGDGADTIEGGDGVDTLTGGSGDDTVLGGRDDDRLIGSDGNDVMEGGSGNDVLVGDNGTIVHALKVTGLSGSGNDTLAGGPGSDLLFGGAGDDYLFGGTFLESGTSAVTEADGADFLDGGDGADTLFADDAHAATTESLPGGSIGNKVWFDANENGLLDTGELGVAGVVVKLYNATSGTLVATTTTDAEGSYEFIGLEAADYYLDFDQPSGLLFTSKDQGADDTIDSDASTVTGVTATFTLNSGQSDSSRDAGLTGTMPSISINDVAVTEGDSGRVTATFTVSLSSMSSQRVAVCYETSAVTANSGVDYEFGSWTLVFEPGMTSLQIEIEVLGDLTDELNESFEVVLDDPMNATLGDAIGEGTVIDDDEPPVVSISDGVQPGALPVSENTPMRFTIRLSNPSYQSISVDWTTNMFVESDGTLGEESAVAGVDFTTSSGTVTFAAGVTEQTILVPVLNDPLDETNERFLVNLALNSATPSTAASIGDETAEAEIQDDDNPPGVFIAAPDVQTVPEGHLGVTLVTFTVNLSAASGRTVTVTYATSRGTALGTPSAGENNDFNESTGTLTFTPSDTSESFTVEVVGDVVFEAAEYFFVNLLSASNAAIGLNHGVIHITNDDPVSGVDHGPWSIQFSTAAYSVSEGDGYAAITILRTENSSEPVAVFWTLEGTADHGVDYTGIFENGANPPRQSMSFGPGETLKTFLIPIVDDTSIEATETVRLFLRNPTGGAVKGGIRTAVLNILDNEPAPSLSINDVSVTEGHSGVVTVTFAVTLSAASTQTVQVSWNTADGTALQSTDYYLNSGSLVFAPGDTSENITIQIRPDTNPEVSEHFVVNLHTPVNATIADYQGRGTIADDDAGTISGIVFMDVNGNGFFDESTEWVLPGVSVEIEDSSGAPTTVTTNSAGVYTGTVLLGNVRIEVDETTLAEGSELTTNNSPDTVEVASATATLEPIGYTIAALGGVPASAIVNGGGFSNDTAYGGAGNDLLDGGGGDDYLIGGHWIGPGCAACGSDPYDATVLSDSGRLIIDPATIPGLGSISGRVTADTNGNGRRDSGEAGVANIQVNLFDEDYNLVASTFTDASGNYSFANLTPCNYYAQFLAAAGYAFTSRDVSGNSFDATDSDADGTTGLTGLIALTASAALANVDAGLIAAGAASPGPWSLQFSHVTYSVRESDEQALITMLRTPGSFEPVGVYFTRDGTAMAGADYTAARATFSLGVGEFERVFTIPVLEDTVTEGYETVLLYLRNPTGGPVHGNLPQAVLLIFDNPCPDDDTVFGHDGADVMLGDFGFFNAGSSTPVLLGGMGNDSLHGEDGNDKLYGEGGNDVLEGGAGNDEMNGGSENDRYLFDGDQSIGADTIVETATPFGGEDTIDLSATTVRSVTLDLSNTTGPQNVTSSFTLTLPATNVIEHAVGGLQNDTLTGNHLDNRLEGGPGADILVGGAGNDTLAGGAGDDTYVYDADSMLDHDDIIEAAGDGTDLLDFSATTAQSVTVNLGRLVSQAVNLNLSLKLSDANGIENLYGGAMGDNLTGNGLDNILQGGAGNDSLEGAGGTDTLLETRAGNFALTNSTLTLNGSETDTYAGFEVVSLVGDDSANTLDATAFSGAVTLDGRGGDDVLRGGSGANTLIGGAGNDTIDGSLGVDILQEERDANFTLTGATLVIGAETDTLTGIERAILIGGEGNNTMDASAFTGAVTLHGAGGDDSLTGGPNHDRLEGGAGNDTLIGGAGNDVYLFDADSALGSDQVTETTGGGADTLDFSDTDNADITLNLRSNSSQAVAGNLQLTLSAIDVIENATGGAGNDNLIGNDLANELRGRGGHDTLSGGLGADTLVGGSGLDTVDETRDSNFTLSNGALAIGSETDLLSGLEQAILTGGAGDNQIDASAFTLGSVTLSGAAGDDTLRGGAGGDHLTGGLGDDVLEGGAGDDTYYFDTDAVIGADTVTELPGGGVDTLDYSATTVRAVNVNLASASPQNTTVSIVGFVITIHQTLNLSAGDAIENLMGGSQADQLAGNDLANRLVGNGGNDLITGAGGNDLLEGGAGGDVYRFNADNVLGSDSILEEVGVDGGTDTLDFSGTLARSINVTLGRGDSQVVVAGQLTLTLNTCHSIENVIGGALADTLNGSTLDNQIEGRGGDDTLRGRQGNDTYVFDADGSLGADTVVELTSAEAGVDTLDFSSTQFQAVTVNLGSSATQIVNGNLTLTLSSGSTLENLMGGAQNDNLTGNNQDNTIVGHAGNDVISGGPGADTLTGGAGNDSLAGNNGDDVYLFDADTNLGSDDLTESALSPGVDTLDFSETTTAGITLRLGIGTAQTVNGNLTLTLSSGGSFENAIGSSAADVLEGNALNNVLTGGLGHDTYLFDTDTLLGADTVVESSDSSGGVDTLDFSATTGQSIDISLARSIPQEISISGSTVQLTLTLSDNAVFENVLGGAQADRLEGNTLNNQLTGGSGNDTYLFDDGWGIDTVIETAGAGSDTMDFSKVASAALLFAISATAQVSAGANTATHAGEFVEIFIGSAANDVMNVTPSSSVPFTLQAGPATGDALNFDAGGAAVTQSSGVITAAGKQPVSHTGFEIITILNAAPLLPAEIITSENPAALASAMDTEPTVPAGLHYSYLSLLRPLSADTSATEVDEDWLLSRPRKSFAK